MKRLLFVAAALLGLQGCATQPADTSRGWEGKPRVVVMTDGEVEDGLDRVVKSGERVTLTARIYDNDPRDVEGAWKIRGHMWQQKGRTYEWLTSDPEAHIEEYRTDWSQMTAGSYPGFVDLQFEGKDQVSFTAPEVDTPQTIHILLEAYDMALPRMTSYARYIITVVP